MGSPQPGREEGELEASENVRRLRPLIQESDLTVADPANCSPGSLIPLVTCLPSSPKGVRAPPPTPHESVWTSDTFVPSPWEKLYHGFPPLSVRKAQQHGKREEHRMWVPCGVWVPTR